MLVTSRDLLHAGPLLTSLPPTTISLFPIIKSLYFGDPWVALRFGACLWPRARSWKPGIESHIGLLVHGACFSLCLCLCLSLSLCDYHK